MTKTLDCAMRLLCRREHGTAELIDKLAKKGYSRQEINEAVKECQRLGLQSDIRFAENLCHARVRQGYGPLRISQELQMKRIDRDLIDAVLNQEHDQWVAHALGVWRKKYSDYHDVSFTELQKRQRFLQYRGFPTSVITELLRQMSTERSLP